ncbi:hypothetical protein, partial [Microcoleus anatoxicus]
TGDSWEMCSNTADSTFMKDTARSIYPHGRDTQACPKRVNLSCQPASPCAHPLVRQGMNSLSNS